MTTQLQAPDEFRADIRKTLQEQSSLAGAVRLTVCAASVCWDDMGGKGVFDSERALILAEELTTEAHRRAGQTVVTDLTAVRAAYDALQGDALPTGTAFPVCGSLLHAEIRHVARNCDVECPQHGDGRDDGCPGTFDPYVGEHVAVLLNAVPDMLKDLENARG